jgi:regulator of replication initiation timing
VQQEPLPYAYPSRSARPAPAAQYSPLAAQGGYRGQKVSWYEALFRSLNPKNIDWGMSWERRRSIFLENSIGNKYFMYTAALSLLLVYSFVVIVWQRWNHTERLRQLAQRAADAMNYAQYWKAGAEKAAQKHNTHIEKCNRVIEAGESGVPAGDTADVGALRQQVEGMRVEVLNLTSENKRLRHDLEQKSTVVADLSARVDDATKKIGSGNGSGNGTKGGENSVQVSTLVDRINRLEETLRTVRLENERLKGA